MKKLLLIFAFCLIGLRLSAQTPVFSWPLNESGAKWGDVLTSGSLVTDETYRIVSFEAGDDFSNLGAVNETGDEFTATGTTPDVWTNSSELRQKMAGVWETQQGRVGVPTDVYNVQDDKGSGRRWFSYDGASGDHTIPDQAEIQNVFAGGGWVGCWVNPRSDGQSDDGFIVSKTSWYLATINESGSNVKIRIHIVFSGDNGTWDTSDAVLPLNQWSFVAMEYDSDATGNNPTLKITTNGVVSTYTEGSGLTTGSPTGAYTSDIGEDLVIGNSSAGTLTFDGDFGAVRLFNANLSGADEIYYAIVSNPIKSGSDNVLELNASGVRVNQWYDQIHGITGIISGNVIMQIPSTSNLGASWFNGATSKITYTGMDGLTGDITISGEFYATGEGEGTSTSGGRIFYNGETDVFLRSTGTRIGIRRDDGGAAVQATGLTLNTKIHFVITSTAAGVTKLYINGVLNTSGATDTPVSGTTYTIGNQADQTRTFDGWIRQLKIYKGIASQDWVTEKFGEYKN